MDHRPNLPSTCVQPTASGRPDRPEEEASPTSLAYHGRYGFEIRIRTRGPRDLIRGRHVKPVASICSSLVQRETMLRKKETVHAPPKLNLGHKKKTQSRASIEAGRQLGRNTLYLKRSMFASCDPKHPVPHSKQQQPGRSSSSSASYRWRRFV